jgi:type II secretory pathway component PulM
MEYGLAAIVLLALVAIVVVRPLSRGEEIEAKEEAEREELEAAKEAKYREIRDAELDHRMGKLSEADWKSVDRDLRGEAIEILRRLDRVEGRVPDTGRRASGG